MGGAEALPLNIAVIAKASLDPNRVRSRSDGSVDVDAMPLALSEYDKNAVEAAVSLKEKHGGRVVVLSVLTWGPLQRRLREHEQVMREALAMGADEAHVVVDEALIPGDPSSTAAALAALANKLGGFDLIVAGEASMDMISSQVAARVAALLGLPFIGFARSLEVTEGKVKARRDLEDRLEDVEAPLPVVVSVTGEANKPRIPTLIQVRRAFRKPVKRYSLDDLAVEPPPRPTIEEMKVLMVKRKNIVIEADSPEKAAEQLIEILVKEGILKA